MTSKKNKSAVAPKKALSPAATPDLSLIAGENAPNIKFCGRDVLDREKRKVLKVADPIDRFSDGGEIVKLPPADFQKRRRLFYHEAAALIATLFPHLYKIVRPKRSL